MSATDHSAHPIRRWEAFVGFLDQSSLNTSTLHAWLGHPVSVGELRTRPGPVLGGEGQYRDLTLTTQIGGESVIVCRAQAQVRLDLLPKWARIALTETRHPLGRTLYRAGATRDRSLPEIHDPQPAGPDEPAVTVRGTFRLSTGGGQSVAVVQESYTSQVLAHRTTDPDIAATVDQRLDDTDSALVELVQQRLALARTRQRRGQAPPVYTVHDELLRMQLCAALGRERGAAIFRAVVGVEPLRSRADGAPATGEFN